MLVMGSLDKISISIIQGSSGIESVDIIVFFFLNHTSMFSVEGRTRNATPSQTMKKMEKTMNIESKDMSLQKVLIC